jgi:S-adenosyl-L-methionine hydrolase (adenosine-forming)
MSEPLVALLTDFGTSDPYVGVMKGIIAARCPAAKTIDITHAVNPQNIRQAAYLLHTAYRYFPAYTVFLVVVDPGVGTARHPLVIQTDHGVYIGPDNGVFSLILDEARTWTAVALRVPEAASATFHGRDVFAPAAADLACGRPVSDLGSPADDPVQIDVLPVDLHTPGTIKGRVIHVDHFGNVITSLGPFEWRDPGHILQLMTRPGEPEIRFVSDTVSVVSGLRRLTTKIVATYGETRPGDLLALINSDRQLEIAVNQGHATAITGLQPGDPITLTYTSRSV